MTVDQQFGRLIIICDSCDEVFDSERGEALEDVWNRAMAEGWIARKPGKQWEHSCPACMERETSDSP
jgi:hypothetical protein